MPEIKNKYDTYRNTVGIVIIMQLVAMPSKLINRKYTMLHIDKVHK